jgi:cytochrome oxidase assembly protein ShyY1
MTQLVLTSYLLVWPILAASVLTLLCVAVWRDLRTAARNGEDFV